MLECLRNDFPEMFVTFGGLSFWNKLPIRIECDLPLAPGVGYGPCFVDKVENWIVLRPVYPVGSPNFNLAPLWCFKLERTCRQDDPQLWLDIT
jgi:hypothetical protein